MVNLQKKNVCLNISENKKSNNIRMSNLAKHKRRFLYKKKKNREHYSTDWRGAALRYYFIFFLKRCLKQKYLSKFAMFTWHPKKLLKF